METTTAASPGFGERLRAARAKAGLTLDDAVYAMRGRVPDRYRITQATLSRWETGKLPERDVDPIALAFLARLYGVTVGSLSKPAAEALESVSGFIDLTTSDADSRRSGWTAAIPGQGRLIDDDLLAMCDVESRPVRERRKRDASVIEGRVVFDNLPRRRRRARQPEAA